MILLLWLKDGEASRVKDLKTKDIVITILFSLQSIISSIKIVWMPKCLCKVLYKNKNKTIVSLFLYLSKGCHWKLEIPTLCPSLQRSDFDNGWQTGSGPVCRWVITAPAMAFPSLLAVPRPNSFISTREWGVVWERMAPFSWSSTRKALSSPIILSSAPSLVSTLSRDVRDT